jgi:hypothetical protein
MKIKLLSLNMALPKMKKFIFFLAVSLSFVYTLPSNAYLNDSTNIIYVSTNGNDNPPVGSKAQPFRNIQPAIDYASDGDVVVVMEGRYSGPGNRNLNFNGKSVTVQSEFPEDNSCLNNTIIDAEGIGFVIRFINNEGSNSVFQGFSIALGDTSLRPIKGIPGFIELSKKANPTTRRLKIISNDSKDIKELKKKPEQNTLKSTTSNSDDETSLYNPYIQPINTTDYYGSGDVDKDGQLTDNDLQKVDSIINGYISPNIRADVNGNGMIDNNDFSLIDSAINYNKILPSWWNQLTTEDEKNRWIDSIIKIDKTDELTYIPGIFKCHHFAKQINYNAFQKFNYLADIFDGSQTIYNLPIFYVSIRDENFSTGHAINTILIENNPLDFYSWRFIESQSDYNVSPGMWDMPYNTYISIKDENNNTKLSFFIDEDGWRIESVDSTFLSNQPNLKDNNNYPYCYNPKIVPNDSGFIMFEKQRDDMTRIMDIHISDNPNKTGIPLTKFNHYSRLFDVKKADSANFHMLWSSKTNKNIPGVYYGLLNQDSLSVTNISRIPGDNLGNTVSFVQLLTNNESCHAFWSKNDEIWHTKKNVKNWTTPEKIIKHNHYGNIRMLKSFDVAIWQNCPIIITSDDLGYTINIIKYSNSNWNNIMPILKRYHKITEITSIVDSFGILHIIYKKSGAPSTSGYFRLFHIYSSDLLNWSNPVQIDSSSSKIQNPSILKCTDNQLILVYEKSEHNQIVPVWRKFFNDTWSEPHYIPVREGANATYTDSYINSNSQLFLAWAAEAMDSLKIESFLVEDLSIPDSNQETEFELTNSSNSDNFIIYPNPARDKVIIKSKAILNSEINLSIIELSGKTVFNDELYLNNQDLSYSLDLSNFSNGIYLIKLQSNNHYQISKLVLE